MSVGRRGEGSPRRGLVSKLLVPQGFSFGEEGDKRSNGARCGIGSQGGRAGPARQQLLMPLPRTGINAAYLLNY